jgi:hypothetical protein
MATRTSEYGGVQFRSRVAAQWAALFDALRVPWRYQETAPGRLDILLPTLGSRKHVAPAGVWLVAERHNGRWAVERDERHCELLCIAARLPVLLAYALPGARETMREFRGVDGDVMDDEPMLLIQCHACALVRFEFSEGDYMTCAACGAVADDRSPALIAAVDVARKA